MKAIQTNNHDKIELTQPYKLLFEELSKDFYCKWNVFGFFIKEINHPKNQINVILRIDVDSGFHLCPCLATLLKEKGIMNASFYFLTFTNRYYNIWESNIPKIIHEKGFEVGLHSDHYYEELISGKNALSGITHDVKKLSNVIGSPIKGMVYHGHPAIDAFNTTNWEAYKNVPPKELGLKYHDGLNSPYTNPLSTKIWRPNTIKPILSDYIGVNGAWLYYPNYPLKILKKLTPGESIHIIIHPINAFKWWKNWDYSYGEVTPKKVTLNQKLLALYKMRTPKVLQYIINKYLPIRGDIHG
jgi:hypothetical protein